jgi:hypothetical protein
MAKDPFSSYPNTPDQPATSVVEVTPNDADDGLAHVLTGLNVETPGHVRVTTKDGSTATVFVAAGTVFPLRVAKVWATGTTATGIRGLI